MSRPMDRPTPTAALLAIALAAGLPSVGCESAVKHPAITAGIVGGTLGFTTCKLGSDNLGACLAVSGGAAAFLGLVAATALWLGGDGNPSVIEEEPVQPLPADGPPRRRRHHPTAPLPAGPAPLSTSPAPGEPAPVTTPAPATPVPATPAPATPVPATPAPATPAPSMPPSAMPPSAPVPPAPPASAAPAPAAPAPALPVPPSPPAPASPR
jgi:hypothetical protein